jgi:hypothetical protein
LEKKDFPKERKNFKNFHFYFLDVALQCQDGKSFFFIITFVKVTVEAA